MSYKLKELTKEEIEGIRSKAVEYIAEKKIVTKLLEERRAMEAQRRAFEVLYDK